MILLADSGSTKTDWILLQQGKPLHFATAGLNPVHLPGKLILKIIKSEKKIMSFALAVKEVYFFGAGCGNEEGKSRVQSALKALFPKAKTTVENDLKAAALATCGNEKGIVCILGTGSNCCYFDGRKIHLNNFGLGYILGDEGSGAWFGKKLLQSFLYDRLPEKLVKSFQSEYRLNREKIIDAVYRQPGANLFLSSFMPFIMANKKQPFVRQLLNDGLEDFFEINILAFPEAKKVPVHFVGSVSSLLESEIRKTGKERKIRIGKILKRPMEGLIHHFSRK